MEPLDLKSMTVEERAARLQAEGYPVFRARQIQDWLEQARDAAYEVMQRSVWSISKQNNDPLTDYRDLFVTLDLTGNQEILWWKQYNVAANITSNVTYYNGLGGGGGCLDHGGRLYLCDEQRPLGS